jgi:hypothetical protein
LRSAKIKSRLGKQLSVVFQHDARYVRNRGACVVCRNWEVGILAVMVRENEKKKSRGGNMHKNWWYHAWASNRRASHGAIPGQIF